MTRRTTKLLILCFCLIFAVIASCGFIKLRTATDSFFPSLTPEVRHLGDYCATLRKTTADAPVYIFDSGVEGGTILLVGGTHSNESAAILSLFVLMENLELDKGRVIVIPEVNLSALSNGLPGYSYPLSYSIETAGGGTRTFRIGSRLLSPLDSWPDPPLYRQTSDHLALGSEEARNLNRAYPGRADGLLSERIAQAIVAICEMENVSLFFDLHEASATYPVNKTYITSEKGADMAFLASMLLETKGISLAVEVAPSSMTGYSYTELSKLDGVYPFLIEVPTPFIDRIPGAMTEDLVTQGEDVFISRMAELGLAESPLADDGYPIEYRVALHLEAIKAVLDSAALLLGQDVVICSFPGYEELVDQGCGAFLHTAESGRSEYFIVSDR